MKKTLIILSLLFTVFSTSATTPAEQKDNKSEVKQHLQNHFKFYGFIRNYFIFDSRESKSGTSDLFYYLPLDQKMNEDGTLDLNKHASFRFVALTSRVGVDVSGYQVKNVHFGAKFEADFYTGLSSSSNGNASSYFPGNTNISGTAQLRLRQAYTTVTWKDLPLNGEQKASVGLKMGQAWHPMGADFPHLFSLEVGAPFGPFSRTPLVQMDANLGKNWILSAAAIWQMQYNSQGPIGASAIYMKYGMTPELYAAVGYKGKDFVVRAGVDLLSIKPRVYGQVDRKPESFGMVTVVDKATVRVSDRKTSLLYYFYAQYSKGMFSLKAKSTFGEGGEHMNLMSGYAKVGEKEDGSWEYASLRNTSSWVSLSYGKKWQGVLFAGYMKNLGIAEGKQAKDPIAKSDVYFCGNGFSNINQMYRINPQGLYNFGKFSLGLEYQWTAVQYGKYGENNTLNNRALATDGLHWVGNHRVNMMVKYTF